MLYWLGKEVGGKRQGCLHVGGKIITPLVDPKVPDPKSKIPKGALSKEARDSFKKQGAIVSLKGTAVTGANEKAQIEADRKAAEEQAAADAKRRESEIDGDDESDDPPEKVQTENTHDFGRKPSKK